MGCWYICSGGTLFLNKIILTELHGDIQVLGGLQMTTTCVLRLFLAARIPHARWDRLVPLPPCRLYGAVVR